MRYKIFILVLAILSYQTVKCQKKITVIGIAEDAKAGAIVVVDSATGFFYYLENLDSWWGTKYYGKKVRVTGIKVVIKKRKNPKGKIAQKVMGDKIVIRNARWSLVK